MPQQNSPPTALISRLITGLALLGALTVTAATLIALIAPDWWVGDILSHLRPQYALALLVALAWLLPRMRRVSAALLVPLIVNLSVLTPLMVAPSEVRSRDAISYVSAAHLHILHYNLDLTAPDHAAAFRFVRDQQADIVFLQELTPALAEQLAAELPTYRVVYAIPLENTHGSALLLPVASTLEVVRAWEIHLPESSPRPLLAATLAVDGRPLTLLSLHVVRPKDAYTEEIQAAEYAAVASWARDQRRQTGLPLLIIGDYNTTPWSARFQRLMAESGLRDSSAGFGYQPTWPAYAPAPLAIPIDHALVSPEIAVLARAVGPDLGGDHTPLRVTIAVAAGLRPAATD
jgi:endonuclease/exonuclease/phosphatase (EEP) superfamily protein YafD